MHTELTPTTVIDFSSEGEKKVLEAVIELGVPEEGAKIWLQSWLVQTVPALDFTEPYKLLSTKNGIDKVIHVIGASVHGVFL